MTTGWSGAGSPRPHPQLGGTPPILAALDPGGSARVRDLIAAAAQGWPGTDQPHHPQRPTRTSPDDRGSNPAPVRACLPAPWDVTAAVPSFDTLALAEQLQRAGFPRGQAEALTAALARIVDGPPAADPGSNAAPPDELRRQLVAQQAAQRAWFNRAMTVWTLVNVLVIAVAAAVVYVALEPSLTPSPTTLAQLFPAIAGAVIGLAGLVVAQFI